MKGATMQFSFMSFSCPELSLDEILALAKKFGYDCVEPRIQAGHAHGIDLDMGSAARKQVRRQARDAGVPYCCVATSCRYANPDTLRSEVENTRRAIDLAADIGSRRVRVFGGQIGGGLDRGTAIDQLARALDSVADQARERDVFVCIETHDDWCDPDHLAQVLDKVDDPYIAANWDIMHPVLRGGKTMDEAFQILRPWIRHIHVHDGLTADGKLELVPIGQGDIDHRRALELLIGMDYDGAVSGEWIGWEPYETHLPRELGVLKEMAAAIRSA